MTDTKPPLDAEPATPDEDHKRDQDRPLTAEEKLEVGVEDSMDASDPPASVAPGDDGEPRPSSGYDEDEEKDR